MNLSRKYLSLLLIFNLFKNIKLKNNLYFFYKLNNKQFYKFITKIIKKLN